jgi:hypothetical protein
MVQIIRKIVDVLMLIFFILTMVSGKMRDYHNTFAWIFTVLVVIHLLLNWRIILSWLGFKIGR